MKRALMIGLISVGLLFVIVVAAQAVPYRVHNPPVTQRPHWTSAQVQSLAQRACLDCHSNETKNPWYGNVAPASWLVNQHVLEARSKLNFSELDRPQKDAHEAGEVVLEREMPPAYYVWLHPEAALTESERETLAMGLDATLRPHFHDDEDHHE